MAASVIFQEQVEIPFVRDLRGFRDWALSAHAPDQGRIDYVIGHIEVDMSPEDFFTHGTVKTEIIIALGQILKRMGTGYLVTDSTRVSCPTADLSVEPDIVFISDQSLDSGRVRLIPKTEVQPDRYVEVEGPPDLIVEIVSDSSVTKDTQRLPAAYYQAGVPEFWLIDARGETLIHEIFRRGQSAYEPVTSDDSGFKYSAIFDSRLQLTRQRNAKGRWVFNLCERHDARK